MELEIRIKMNDKLYLRNPEDSALGRKIVQRGLLLINKLGFEEFNFKKLASEIGTTEAGIYRYFENKHRLLTYLINWYWSYLEYKVVFSVNNLTSAEEKLHTFIRIISEAPNGKEMTETLFSEKEVQRLVMWEGSKAYLTRNVSKDNKDRLFKPYKDLCSRMADIIKAYNPKYKFPHSLASTLLEMAHAQRFFMHNMPSLTDISKNRNDASLRSFLENLLFESIRKGKH